MVFASQSIEMQKLSQLPHIHYNSKRAIYIMG